MILDDALIQEICALWRHQALFGDEYSRRPEGLFSEELEERAEERTATHALLREMLQKNRLDRIEPALRTFRTFRTFWAWMCAAMSGVTVRCSTGFCRQ